ncbi:thioredoxin domain-containing protein [Novosphingobium profundi]|uniref:thioredoxin domain-containing protein n=1 Tax=Novosphingobium profundi TaxID=1774954 RepID=UPI001BDA9C6B|nr:thioredoxin domain-containing protein [Novosphingobium profundi]MBT0668046.1 thioredoxin domain-containing protein [Novosphingobium profundi]
MADGFLPSQSTRSPAFPHAPSRPVQRLPASPYLGLHAQGPISWQCWNPETFHLARQHGTPVLLSVGFGACHWCAAMAREAFRDPVTARFINASFVPVLVDRDERPDIDYVYQSALGLLGQRGGWPLTMILDPEGRPFWGGTYFPLQSENGRLSLGDALREALKAFDQEGIRAHNLAALSRGLAQLAPSASRWTPPDRIVKWARVSLLEQVDWQNGGFGAGPKFPEVPALDLLWEGRRRHGDVRAREAVLLSLDRMCLGGLYDHLGGGFARFAVDEAWRVPHFEKMASDNALLIELLTKVWLSEGNPLHAARVRETVAWLAREMRVSGGAFAQCLGAESDGQDGAHYLWQAREIRTHLGEGAPCFMRAYAIAEAGNGQERHILHRLDHPERPGASEESQFAAARASLLRVREKRIPPARDERVLADTNGMLIAALAAAGQAFARADWIELAAGAFAFIAGTSRGREGRLLHVAAGENSSGCDFLDDYAQMARAALALHAVTAGADYLRWAERWAELAERHFADRNGGGYFLTPHDGQALCVRPKNMRDTHVPSGNAAMIDVHCELYRVTGQSAHLEAACQTAASLHSEALRGILGLEGLLTATEALAALKHDSPARPEAASQDNRKSDWTFPSAREPFFNHSISKALRNEPLDGDEF